MSVNGLITVEAQVAAWVLVHHNFCRLPSAEYWPFT